MAVSTVISAARAGHRTARVMYDGFQGCLALDYANAQAIALAAGSAQSAAFDASNDRVVMVSVGGASTVGGCWISVGNNPTASGSASSPGSMWIAQAAQPTPVYVPAGMLIAGIQGQTGGTLSMIPALLSGN